MTVIPLLQSLRQATRSQHEHLDAGLAAQGEPTLDRYRAFLRATLAVIEAIEPQLGRWIPWLEQRRAAALHADLAALGDPNHPPSQALQPLANRAAAYGTAYVVEGSSLGGMVLAARFESSLGLAPEHATRYLRLRGRDTQRHWTAFVSDVSSVDQDFTERDRSCACDAAVATFAAYRASFIAHGVIAP